MNTQTEVSSEERLADLSQAYGRLRDEVNGGVTVDAQKATALAHLSIAISLLERDAYAEEEYAEDDEDEDDDEEDL